MANDPSHTEEQRDAGTQPVERYRWLWPLLAWLAIGAALGGTLWYAFTQTGPPRADPATQTQQPP